MGCISENHIGLRTICCLMLLAVTSACSNPSIVEKEDTLPNGRYMMLNGPDGGVYVLNTTTGFIRFCQPRSTKMAPNSDGGELEVECGAGVTI